MSRVCLVALLVLTLGGCGRPEPTAPERRRPVTVYKVRRFAPVRFVRTTGVAEPYRQADVGFDVGGKVRLVRDVGDDVKGPNLEQVDGGVRESKGEVIAEIEPLRYEQAVQELGFRLESAQAGRAALVLELEQLVPASIERARAQGRAAAERVKSARAGVDAADASRENAKVELRRSKRLLDEKRISRSDYDAAETAFDNAEANHRQSLASLAATEQELDAVKAALLEAEASKALKTAAIKQADADIQAIEQRLSQARTDLDDCRLRAPFSGRITKVFVSRGGFVAAGAPVLTLTLADPIKIAATVSGDEERAIAPGTIARIEPRDVEPPRGGDSPLVTYVREKASVADAATRTFRVEVMLRNWRLPAFLPPAGTKRVVIDRRRVVPVLRPFAGETGPLMAFERCIVREGGTAWLAVLPELRQGGEPRALARGTAVELVEIEPLPTYHTFLSYAFQTFRQKPGGTSRRLGPGDMVVGFDLEPEDPPDRADLVHLKERGVFIRRTEWAIRPGDLVPVRFETGVLPEGFYVPIRAVLDLNGEKSVFVVDDDGTATRIAVVPAEQQDDETGDLRRVEASALSDGMRIVVDGVQYVSEGIRVEVVGDAKVAYTFDDGHAQESREASR